MSIQTRVFGFSIAIALAAGVAMAGPVITKANPALSTGAVIGLAKCAPGFTANPATADNVDTHHGGKTYTCTGPAVYCMLIYTVVSPVTIEGGHMVYTCRQPEHIY
jgi:uncharacterized protein YbjT (DUF2867 family)